MLDISSIAEEFALYSTREYDVQEALECKRALWLELRREYDRSRKRLLLSSAEGRKRFMAEKKLYVQRATAILKAKRKKLEWCQRCCKFHDMRNGCGV